MLEATRLSTGQLMVATWSAFTCCWLRRRGHRKAGGGCCAEGTASARLRSRSWQAGCSAWTATHLWGAMAARRDEVGAEVWDGEHDNGVSTQLAVAPAPVSTS